MLTQSDTLVLKFNNLLSFYSRNIVDDTTMKIDERKTAGTA
jgi:hypothetical protein